ncbi:MAG: PilZ domain-containing protein [Syntrophobacteraceae bacterium]
MIELRRFDRYSTKDNFYIYTDQSCFSTVGCVKDISSGGLGFTYVDEGETPTGVLNFDIFGGAGTFIMPNIRCKVIYTVPGHEQHFFTVFVAKRCGLQFENLSEEQRAELLDVLREKIIPWSSTDQL